MKGTFRIDPAACRYGVATAAVQQILADWMAIDWFAAPDAAAEAKAAASFVEHHRRARAFAPDLFAEEPNLVTTRGDFSDFCSLCARVRSPSGWDWKFGALKPLSHRHAQARGWSLRDWASSDVTANVPCLDEGEAPGPGDLLFRLGEGIIWNNIGPELSIDGALPKDQADAAHFYLWHACVDLTECLAWQLAEESADLGGNPFVPLLRCYGAGGFPFALGPGTFVLFAFRQSLVGG